MPRVLVHVTVTASSFVREGAKAQSGKVAQGHKDSERKKSHDFGDGL